jgi:hydroxyacylglutathione hydrolase
MIQTDLGHGVYEIPGMGFSNAYLVELDQRALALVDTGTPGKGQKILPFLTTLGRKPAELTNIILTHPDADHSGSAAELRRATGAKLSIGELDAPRISGEKKLKEVSGIGSLVTGMFGALMRVERVKPDQELKDGDRIGPLSVILTPGHTDGSVSLLKANEAIFVGDLLRTDGSASLKLPSPNMSREMSEVRRSVERISKLEFEMLLPGHGRPITEGASRKLREFVAMGYR